MSGMPLQRVTRTRPCPICRRPDWCTVTADGRLAICMRVPEGAKKRSANGGFVHVLRDDRAWRSLPRARVIPAAVCEPQRADLDRLARQYREAVDGAALQVLADSLGLSTGSLRRLRIGWDSRRRAWTFPMVNPASQVVGVRLRFPDGRKLAVTGGREGLFIPDGLDYSGSLILAEGPTDCAALLDLGFPAIGRPSCSGAVRHCTELVRAHWPLDVVAMADSDVPGKSGAQSLALALLPFARSVRVIQPPAGLKDARAWKRSGAMRAEVQTVIDSAPVLELAVRGVRHGR